MSVDAQRVPREPAIVAAIVAVCTLWSAGLAEWVGPSDTWSDAGSDDPGPRVGPASGKSRFRFTRPHPAGRGD